MTISYTHRDKFTNVAIISKGFRPMLIINDKYSDFQELMEYVESNDIICYDDEDIATIDSRLLGILLTTENNKNKYKKSLIESDESIENIELKTLEIITEYYYVDDYEFLWIKK